MRLLLLLGLTLPLAACGSEVEAEAEANIEAAALPDMTVSTGVHTVQCGCSIESVGACGNYVEIDSHFVEISNSQDLGLGAMEWCGSGPAKAEVAGEVKDGAFVASAFEIQE